MKTHRISLWILILFFGVSGSAQAQGLDPTIRTGATEQATEHVYWIPDEKKPIIPNVGFVVGDRATLVIDSGLGMENGKIVLAEARKLAPTNKLYVAATHTHPEHDLGAIAFPEDATIVRSSRQQQDIEEYGMGLAQRFASFSERSAELLKDAYIRPSDVVFSESMTLDLGGVHVKFIQAGPTHTRGDLVFHVIEDNVMFTGDVVMNAFPMPISPTSSINQWFKTLDMLEEINPDLIIPSHYATGDSEMIRVYRTYFKTVQERAHEMADKGIPVESARETLQEEIHAIFSQWPDPGKIHSTVMAAYRERD